MYLFLILEQKQQLELKWLPVSCHHDGCALLVEESFFDFLQKNLVDVLKRRLDLSKMQIKELELIPYNRSLDELPEVDLFLQVPDNQII